MRTETSPSPGSADEPKRRLEKLAGARTRHLKPRLAPKRATLRTKVHGFSSNATPNEPERPPSGQEKDAQATANEPRRQRTNPGGAKRTQATGNEPRPPGTRPRGGRKRAGAGGTKRTQGDRDRGPCARLEKSDCGAGPRPPFLAGRKCLDDGGSASRDGSPEGWCAVAAQARATG